MCIIHLFIPSFIHACFKSKQDLLSLYLTLIILNLHEQDKTLKFWTLSGIRVHFLALNISFILSYSLNIRQNLLLDTQK